MQNSERNGCLRRKATLTPAIDSLADRISLAQTALAMEITFGPDVSCSNGGLEMGSRLRARLEAKVFVSRIRARVASLHRRS
jgi:hypothetical protein